MSTLGERINAYANKVAEIGNAEEVVKNLKLERVKQEEVLLDDYAKDGIQNMKTADGRTVYLFQDLYVKQVGDTKKFHTAMKRAGGTDLVRNNVNASSLRAFIKEFAASEKGIPRGLQPYIETTDGFSIRVRRS